MVSIETPFQQKASYWQMFETRGGEGKKFLLHFLLLILSIAVLQFSSLQKPIKRFLSRFSLEAWVQRSSLFFFLGEREKGGDVDFSFVRGPCTLSLSFSFFLCVCMYADLQISVTDIVIHRNPGLAIITRHASKILCLVTCAYPSVCMQICRGTFKRLHQVKHRSIYLQIFRGTL